MHSHSQFHPHRLRNWCASLRLLSKGPLPAAMLLACTVANAHPTPIQPSPADHQAQAWRQANEVVAQFPRGHADVLKAEANLPLPPHRPTFPTLPDPQALQRAALLQRIDLWATPSDNALTRLKRQQAIATWSRDVLQAWWLAAASAEEALLAADEAESARLAAELARRMAQVGNWSEMRQLQLQRSHLIAEQEARSTQQTAWASHQALQRLVMTDSVGDAPHPLLASEGRPAPLPASATINWSELLPPPAETQLEDVLKRLPQRPDWQALHARHRINLNALAPEEWQQTQQIMGQRLTPPQTPTGLWVTPPEMRVTDLGISTKVAQTWNEATTFHTLRAKLQTQTLRAWQRLHAAHQALRNSSQQVVTATRLEEETQLRANGMLASTWDVLAAQRNRVDAARNQVRAQRDWQWAWLDWQAVQAGADPALPPFATGTATANAEGL